MSLRATYALILCALVMTIPAPADILFTDTTFNPANYNNFSATQILDGGVTATYRPCTSCRNPSQALEAIVSIPGTAGGAFEGFLNDTFTYNPQTDGAILPLTVSVDKDVILGRNTTYLSSYFHPLIEEGGNCYIATLTGRTINSGNTTGYETISGGLEATNLGLYDFGTNSVPNFSSNPDLSGNGAPVIFGLAPRVSANDAFTITVDYDNLDFDIVAGTHGAITQATVPESSSLGLLSIFVMGVVLRVAGTAIRWKLKRQ